MDNAELRREQAEASVDRQAVRRVLQSARAKNMIFVRRDWLIGSFTLSGSLTSMSR